MKDREYKVTDLHDGVARDRVEAHPDAWAAFLKAMKGRKYGREPLTDAWLWFLHGWTDGACSAGEMERSP